jgi:endonuclease III
VKKAAPKTPPARASIKKTVTARAPKRKSRTNDHPDLPFTLPRVTPAEKRRAAAILAALESAYPGAKCALNFKNPHELLVATILSAQATDVSVNKASPALFARFPSPAAYAAASPAEIEPYIRTIGLYRNKAKSVHSAMKDVAERFGGEVPRNMDDLLTLRGVARKTANVVLGNAYGMNEGFVVDTHIERLSKRFALVQWTNPVKKIEQRLMALFPRDRWCDLSHMIISHGRQVCRARLPAGTKCQDNPICAKFGTACECREPR